MHGDTAHNNEHVKAIHRLYAPVLIDGVLYRVKLTVKDYVFTTGMAARKNLHAIETLEIEKGNALLGTVPSYSTSNDVQTAQPTTGRTISIANLMQGVIRQDGSAFVTNDDADIDEDNPTPSMLDKMKAKLVRLEQEFNDIFSDTDGLQLINHSTAITTSAMNGQFV
jgi:hypothetical protein